MAGLPPSTFEGRLRPRESPAADGQRANGTRESADPSRLATDVPTAL